MTTSILLIDPEIDGAQPLKCEVNKTQESIEIHYNGRDGWILKVKVKDIMEAIRQGEIK